MITRNLGLAVGTALSLFAAMSIDGNALGQAKSGLTAAAAFQAVDSAVKACAGQGYKVTATVVNKDGLLVAVLRGDGAPPHTLDSSRQKAYTAASFSPIVNMDKTSEIAERLLGTQTSAQLAHLPNVLLVGGGVAIRSEGEVVGGIGVGGAPGGHLDEACATVGLAKIVGLPK